MTAKETRIETESGGAKGDKLARFDQIPAGPMLELAYRYGLGSTKYAKKNGLDNWRNGYPFSLSMAALERHYYAFKNGEDNDATIYAEAGLLEDGEHPLYDDEGKLRPGVSHLSAVVWHCFFLMHHLEENPQHDDRPSTVIRRNKEEARERKLEELFASVFATGPDEIFATGPDEERRVRDVGALWKNLGPKPVIPEAFLPTEAREPARWRAGVGEPWREIYPGRDGVYRFPDITIKAPEVTVEEVRELIQRYDDARTDGTIPASSLRAKTLTEEVLSQLGSTNPIARTVDAGVTATWPA